jgi:hypothetical protein
MRNSWLREDLLVTHATTNALNALHGHEQASTMERGSDESVHPSCGTNLVCCILYALSKTLSGVNNVGVNRVFHGTPQVKVYRIEVWWSWWPQLRSLGTTADATSGIIPAWPFPKSPHWNVLEHHRENITSVVVRATKILKNWGKFIRRNRKHRGPVSFAGNIRWQRDDLLWF